MEEKRKRGGQHGNQNATKHGYYSQELNKQERLDFDAAAGMQGIDEEIALLRYKIKKAIIDGDLADLIPLSKISYALEKLIRTNQKLFAPLHKQEDSLRKVIREVLIPLDGDLTGVAELGHLRYPDEFPPVSPTNQNEKSFQPQNEAGLTYNQ
jgi:hypothetical protein